jgi:hypothetical protein
LLRCDDGRFWHRLPIVLQATASCHRATSGRSHDPSAQQALRE